MVIRTPRKRIVGREAPDGYLFGSAAKFPTKDSESFTQLIKDVKTEREFGIELNPNASLPYGAWSYHSKPLEQYAGEENKYNLSEILAEKIRQHTEFKLTPFRVLDAGIGTGRQWFDFARKHGFIIGQDFEIWGTSLTRNGVIPELRDKVKLCTANNIHLKFRTEEPFDFVVSHFGMHGMEEAGIESAFRVVKPGGELFVCGANTRTAPNLIEAHQQYAKLIAAQLTQNTATQTGLDWFLHLKKK